MRSRLRWWPGFLVGGFAFLGLYSAFWAADGAAPSKAEDARIRAVVKTAINKGADLHNIYRDSAGCYRYYQGSLTTIRPFLDQHADLQKAIDAALTEAERSPSMAQRGLILNGALRKIWDKLGPAAKPVKDSARVSDKRADDKPAADGKPVRRPADKVVPKDALKDSEPADKPINDKKPSTEKVPFDKAEKGK